eukprot:TRINITY_DN2448_c0_g1_i2.p1 TRINITY_DN2448_c0_g1~~TRINITY_DN2448_c0_g1_i2.p1  ORF type:complete len:170 (+),score=31.29 TRINITY_DN2448_c0_g1_i2:44-553(+)
MKAALAILTIIFGLSLAQSSTGSQGSFEINVTPIGGSPIKFTVSAEDKVLRLKEQVQQSKSYYPEEQILIFAGRKLEDDKTLGSYNIRQGSTVYLFLSIKAFPISVQHSSTGKTWSVYVRPSATVKSILWKLKETSGSSFEKPTLYYNCLLYTSPSPRDRQKSRMPSSA